MGNQKSNLQSATDHTDAELAHHGAQFSASRLGVGAKAILSYAKVDAKALEPFGFGANWRTPMLAALKGVALAKNVRVSKASAARPSGETTSALFLECQAYVLHAHAVLHACPRAVAKLAPSIDHHGNRPGTIATTVRSYAAFFESHDKETKAHAGGAKLGKQGSDLATRYEEAHAAHASALADVSPEVHALHVEEGIVAYELDRLSGVAHRVLPPSRAKLYATTSLRPKPSKKKKSSSTTVGASPGTSGAPSTSS